MTHPTRAFSGSIINRLTGSKILARVGQISVAFPATPVTDVKSIEINSGKPFNLYTVDGRLVAKDIYSLKGIRKGIYVVNGKTIIKK